MTTSLITIRRFSLLMLIAVTLSACSGGSADDFEPQPSALAVAPYAIMGSAQYTAVQRFSGQVEAARQSALGFELGGELAEVTVDEGTYVPKGTVLARLDDDRLSAARREAEAALAQARAQAALSQATFERVRDARQFDGVSEQEVDEARERQQRTAAAALAAEAQLARIKVDLAKTQLRAPYDASVVRRHVDEGQVLGAGQPVLDIQESAALRVRLSVSGDALVGLTEGKRVDLDINGEPVAATVGATIARRNLRTRAVEVLFDIDEGAPARVGDIAELTADRVVVEPGFWLPVGALTEGARGVWSVLAIVDPERDVLGALRATGATHQLEMRPIEIIYQDAEQVYARGALQSGDLIVGDGLQRVVSGQTIRVSKTVVAERDTVSSQEPAL